MCDRGEFVTPGELIANGEVIFENEDVTVYSFENVDVWIWRDIPGEVYLEVEARTRASRSRV